MNSATVTFLLDLNRQFYQSFGAAFAATRRRIQPGVRRILDESPAGENWLDLGCGSGSVALEWARKAAAAADEKPGNYLGLDFSDSLLEEARRTLKEAEASGDIPAGRVQVEFAQTDLSAPDWADVLRGRRFDRIVAFAVLHHLPGMQVRRQVLRGVHDLLAPGGLFIHSEWQFQHSPKLMARRLPWEQVGLSAADLEEGDTLLDWRYNLNGPARPAGEAGPDSPIGPASSIGRRYVHLYSREELNRLAAEVGFVIRDEFESDGEGGRLGLYQIWERDTLICGVWARAPTHLKFGFFYSVAALSTSSTASSGSWPE
jgi:SAM-dependent methyltransferase